jgi:hypothetical protein
MGGRRVWAELRIAGRELKADYTFSFPNLVSRQRLLPVRVQAVAAPEATKAEGKPKRLCLRVNSARTNKRRRNQEVRRAALPFVSSRGRSRTR